MRPLLTACIGIALLSACGQKGPLVRPQPAHARGVPAKSPEARPAAEPAAASPRS